MRQLDTTSPVLPSARSPQDFTPTRSEPGIIGFAAFSLLGAIAMCYYCGSGLDAPSSTMRSAADTPVYNGRAVPLDDVHRPLGAAFVNAAPKPSADNLESVVNDGHRTHSVHPDEHGGAAATPIIVQGAPLYSFPEFDAMQRGAALGSASAVAGSVASQSASGNVEAPEATLEAFAPVPETGGWSSAGAFAFLLCLGERLRRRTARR